MSYSNVFLLLSGLVCFLFLFVEKSAALRCYECNSHNDSRCADSDPPVELSVQCPDTESRKYVLCRKIKQVIEFEVNGLPPDSRTIRSCGWVDTSYKDTCYHRSGFGGRQEVCSCTSDNCNSAPLGMSSAAVPLALALALALATLLRM